MEAVAENTAKPSAEDEQARATAHQVFTLTNNQRIFSNILNLLAKGQFAGEDAEKIAEARKLATYFRDQSTSLLEQVKGESSRARATAKRVRKAARSVASKLGFRTAEETNGQA